MIVQTQLHKVVDSLEDVLAVSSDTFVLSSSKFVIEFHHEGKTTIGHLTHSHFSKLTQGLIH
ncbi:hypothetical protein [Paenibacillus phyllosphaerae]|uniref:CDI toxin immunity protein n=1 Tax=Paenibacillus phyllosphaerae TaxID=274593 RepID=UPI003CCD34F2